MTTSAQMSKSNPLVAIGGITIATVAVTLIILGLTILSNNFEATQNVNVALTVPYFILGLVLFAKTQVDGVLLMTRLLASCNNDMQVMSVLTSLTLTNGAATIGMDGVYLTVSNCLWLLYFIIIIASCYLLQLAYEGYVELKEDENHNGIPDSEEGHTSTFKDKTLKQVAIIAFSELIILYGDGTAANLELLTPENYLSLNLAGVFGMFVLAVGAATIPREKVAAVAQNRLFHISGVIAFVVLSSLGFFESCKGAFVHYQLLGVGGFIGTIIAYILFLVLVLPKLNKEDVSEVKA